MPKSRRQRNKQTLASDGLAHDETENSPLETNHTTHSNPEENLENHKMGSRISKLEGEIKEIHTILQNIVEKLEVMGGSQAQGNTQQ